MSNLAITILGVCSVFFMTCLGGAFVFFFKNSINKKIYSLCLGFASGLMLGASIWSLIIPALTETESWGKLGFLPIMVGILIGTAFLILIDFLLGLHYKKKKEFHFDSYKKASKIFFAVTVHNIPEGLATGIAYGSAFLLGGESFYSALIIAIGIGVQNFPEGLALALSLKGTLKSKKKAFFLTVLSAIVEPIMVLVGVLLSSSIKGIIPWCLSFSAGAMMYVVCEELLPDAQTGAKNHVATLGFIIGFIVILILDIVLG